MSSGPLSHDIRVCACHHLAVWQAQGLDAQSFLQSQLTQDMARITTSTAAFAGFCNAQGRLWANFLAYAVNAPTDYAFVVSQDLLDALLKRLRMFVLRSKVRLEPQSDTSVYGLEVNAEDLPALSELTLASSDDDNLVVTHSDFGTFIRIPSHKQDRARYLLVATTPQYERFSRAADPGRLITISVDQWRELDIAAGVAWVEAKTRELFIPQTINLDLIDGVSFTKGCYPGQEVVARAHYRGTVKRRMHAASFMSYGESYEPGVDIFDLAEPDSPVGRAVMVANLLHEKSSLLFEAPFQAVSSGELRIGSPKGPSLSPIELPYAIEPQKV